MIVKDHNLALGQQRFPHPIDATILPLDINSDDTRSINSISVNNRNSCDYTNSSVNNSINNNLNEDSGLFCSEIDIQAFNANQQTVEASSAGGGKEENGMTLSSPSASLIDLLDCGSCSSDKLHHLSLSSSEGHSGRCSSSLSSSDSVSDTDSCSSLDADPPRHYCQKLFEESDTGSLQDSSSLGFHSRPSSQGALSWTSDAEPQFSNDLSPEPLLSVNINELPVPGSPKKSLYSKSKLLLANVITSNNTECEDNGNYSSVGVEDSLGAETECKPKSSNVLTVAESAGNESEDENLSDIEHKMAETKVKMNDALLSNGREELFLHNRKMKQYRRQKEKQLRENAAGSCCVKQIDQAYSKNNSINNNNNHLLQHQVQPKQQQEQLQQHQQQHQHEKETLNLKLVDESEDNRLSAIPESPIVDAYEKECLDVPEKLVREFEKENGSKEKNKSLAKEETGKHKEVEKVPAETDAEYPVNGINESEEVKRGEIPHISDAVKSQGKGLSHKAAFKGRVDVHVKRHNSPRRCRERNSFRKSVPLVTSSAESRNCISPEYGEFDVYTMETALPKFDWEAIEAHLNATKEVERRRRNDREEIRRKLALGVEDEMSLDRPLRKPSLQSRLQSGMNLQICFMNETASDCESQCSDTESTQDRVDVVDQIPSNCTSKTAVSQPPSDKTDSVVLESPEDAEVNFFTQQAQLQAEARMALAQAKEMARMQMEIEKQNQKRSPITEIVRESFRKIGVSFPDTKRRMSRQILTDMNVAQLQVIVNDLHTQIEILNEELVRMLLERDDLHMEQDSMLVDTEDLTKHLDAKQQSLQSGKSVHSSSSETRMVQSVASSLRSAIAAPSPSSKAKSLRLRGLVKK